MADLTDVMATIGSQAVRFNGSWYRGEHTNFIPSKDNLREPGGLTTYVLQGWTPKTPFITRASNITAFGSCFAAHISDYLHERGFCVAGRSLDLNAHIIRFGEGIVNSFAILQQLEWALEDKAIPENLWFGPNKEIATVDPQVRATTYAVIKSTDVFIITLGLAEIWYDKLSGEAFWRAIPQQMFDGRRHGFRISTVEENTSNLRRIRDLIAQYRPDAHLVLTLSPIPLMATFRPISCITANAVSKSVLRVAIDQLMLAAEGDDRLHYFPSYEIVTQVLKDPFGEDNRHIHPHHVTTIMKLFEDVYCT